MCVNHDNIGVTGKRQTYKCHVSDAAGREVVIVGMISACCTRKHDVVATGEVWIDKRRHTFRPTVVLVIRKPHLPRSHAAFSHTSTVLVWLWGCQTEG